ncbi:uncharacterized protein VTP21DRAFT_3201 [Calcarisporiella thermophila]|uniref:uncharacterized protein n=1 Tax=Calcarisporiella thermophila TaxID=911321 RepID=UPI00374493E3
MAQFTLSVAIFLALLTLNTAETRRCRCMPKDSCWPDAHIWERFNVSVGGRLLAPLPLGSPCHNPYFYEVVCNITRQRLHNPFWRAEFAGGMQFTNWKMDGDEGCPINVGRNTPCIQGAIPLYVVNVSNTFDVQRTVEFASSHNLRLVIKNIGHDFLGRNEFTADGCIEGTSAVTVEAGVLWETVYKEAAKCGLEVVGGQALSVGAAGDMCKAGDIVICRRNMA